MASTELSQPKVFTRTSQETFRQDTPKRPYLTFTLGPGKLERLVVKIWSHDQGWCDEYLNTQDPYAISPTWFSFALINEATPANETHELYEFQRNVRASTDMRCYTNEWKPGIPGEEEDSSNAVHGWIESLAEAEGSTIGVFPLAEYLGWVNLVWKMEVQVFPGNTHKGEGTEPPLSTEYGDIQLKPGHRYSNTAELISQDEVITIAREVVKATPEDHPNRVGLLDNLGIELGNRYMRTGATSDLEEAITTIRGVVKATPKDHPHQAGRLNNLGVQLGNRYSRNGAMADLDEALAIAQEVVKSTPDAHPNRPGRLNNLGVRLGDRYWHTGAMTDLEEAINVARKSVDATPEDHPDRLVRLRNLGNRLGDRYSRTGAMADLEEAIALDRKVVQITPEDHPDQACGLDNLGVRLGHRYSRTGAMTDLEEAIALARGAMKAKPKDHPDRAGPLFNLGSRLGDRYSRTGAMTDLEEAIAVARKVVQITPEDHPNRPCGLNNLGSRLGDRYSRTGAMTDLEGAIYVTREAVKATPQDHQDRARWLNNLGVQLSNRYSRTRAMTDLEEAISIAREVANTTPEDHPNQNRRLNNLGLQLSIRYLRNGVMVDLEEAIPLARKVIQITPEDHPDRARWLNNLGAQLSNRYSRTGAITDLEEAITTIRGAVKATPKDLPDRAGFLFNLGVQLSNRYLRNEAIADLEEAKICFKEAMNIKVATTSQRIRAAAWFLSLILNILRDPQGDYIVAETAVNLIPLLSSFSLQSSDKQYQLRQAVGLSSNAAAIALYAGRGPLAALQLLETGRGILAGSFQNIRTDLSSLQENHPDLAHAFVQLRDQLDAPTQNSDLASSQLYLTKPTSAVPDDRHKASSKMDSLVHTIRSRPGFERFLLSATEEEMREAAVYGPIIVINVSLHRCDALIIEHSEVRVINLPQLTQAGLKEHAGDLGSVKTLAWLWDAVVNPVLDALRFTQPPDGDAWPHVWWVPTGPLTRFPLHAAGRHTKNSTETALDRVVSSYSSSIRSIIHTRRQERIEARADGGLNVVLVDMPETPGRSSDAPSKLANATRETDAVREVCKSFPLAMRILFSQPPAHKKDVLAALKNCQILHFAGHGGTRPDPLQSLLLLKDWVTDPLTVESLLATNLSTHPPFLAYLSACGTGRIQDDRSVDESIHLTSAFQLAGFRHVIGTLWEVDDELCVDIARLTYEFIGAKGLSDESVSRGLHHATRALRDEWVERQRQRQLGSMTTESILADRRDIQPDGNARHEEALWVPYVHFGV